MTCTLVIDAKLLEKNHLGYKYVVFSPRMAEANDCYEKLHPFVKWGDDPNRCLWIPPEIYDRVYGGRLFYFPGLCVLENVKGKAVE